MHDFDDVPDDKRVIKSYVWHKGTCFFVSTIMRPTSALVQPPIPMYPETIGWLLDWDSGERRETVVETGCNGGESAAFEQHQEVVRQLFETGKYEEPN